MTSCRACPRLVSWREAAAEAVPRRYRPWVAEHGFWAGPLEAFGDRRGWLAIVGLAPAAQGGNRTGRMFTGDSSGDFLYAALHRAGFASRAVSEHPNDGLELRGALITAAVRCAPPGNRPTGEEAARCRPFLHRDLASLARLRVILALGRFAHDAVVALAGRSEPRPGQSGGHARSASRTPDPGSRSPVFRHGAEHLSVGGVWLVDSYHVSQRNTFTGLLTAAMFDRVLWRCRVLGEAEPEPEVERG